MNARLRLLADASPARATVLVVDDNPMSVEVIGRLPQPLRTVREATSSRCVLRAACAATAPDLILRDNAGRHFDPALIEARASVRLACRAITEQDADAATH
jgi:CheY-like chemotaxis protein